MAHLTRACARADRGRTDRARHAGRRTAGEVLLSLVDETRAVAGAAATAALLVVGDDHALRASLRAKGARTAGSAWLLGRLERPKLSAPSVRNRRPARGGPGPSGGSHDDSARSGHADHGRSDPDAPLEAGARRHDEEGQPTPRSTLVG